MSSQSTLAKITRPRLVRVYNRQRLFDRLDHARERPIIWISAPAGAGKTTLVASYIRERNLPCIWYNLDEGDGDIGSFFYYMGLANKNADPGKRKSLPLLTSEYLANLPDFTRRYFRDLFAHIRTPGVLVLDNYEAAPAESHLHEVIRYGLTEVPEGIHVIIVSRVDTPKALVGFRASDGLDMLTWDDLRLTPEESKNICQLHKKKTFSTKALQTLHRQTRGWVAGLVLLLGRNGDHSISEGLKDQGSREPIFDYFAYEVFRSVDKDVQSFLMRTSVLSRITATLAEQLTDAPEAERILRRLTQKNLFTVKLTGSEPTYEYHPLFREFLLNQMGKAFEPQVVTALRIKAAHLLVGAGELEEAAELFRQAGAWDTLAELICEHAADFLAQGRNRTLEKLIRTLPDEMMEEHPWLPYWLGIACLPFNPVESRLHLERAYQAFEHSKNRPGMFLTCAAAFETFIHQWGDFAPADRWIERVETLLEEDGYPSAHVEASIVPSMCHILVWRNPMHSNFPQLCKRLSDLIHTTTDLNQRVHMVSILLAIASWNGNLLSLAPLLEDCRMISKADDIPPMTRLCLLLQEATYAWNTHDPDICRQAVGAAMTIADDTGIHIMDSKLLGQGVYNALSCDTLEEAEEYLSRMFPFLEQSRPLDAGHYHYLKGWYAFARAELKTALAHTKAALQSCIDAGTPFPLALNHFAMANILLEMKRHGEAEKHLDAGLDIAYAMNSFVLQYMGLSIRAYYGFEGGMNQQAMKDLQDAFFLGKEQGFLNTPWWRSDLMAKLCVKALALGIEPDYAGTLIRKRNLIPKDPPLHLDNWPWPVKIHALGTFTLFQDGTPVRFSGKAQKKPLELLKALIAFEGKDVHTEQLADALWPDAEGGTAYKTLVMALQRLRKILGYKDVITLSEGRLTLDPRRCWVDVWAFEELLEQGTTDPIKIEQALELYRGPFLDNHIDPFWAISMRERLQRKFMRAIVTMAQYWETRDNVDKAIDCYERGLDVNDCNEEFYRKLIQCHEKLGRRAEALMTYNHCKHMLHARLGVTPSIETQDLYRRISTG